MPLSLPLVVMVPAAGALLLLAVPPGWLSLARAVTVSSSGLALALAMPLWFGFEPRGPQWQFADRFAAVDGFGLSLVIVTAVVAFALATAAAIARAGRVKVWGSALLAMEAGVLGAFVSLDLIQMFVCWHIAVAALLAMAWTTQSRRAFAVSGVIAIAGALAMLAGILMLRAHYHGLAAVSGPASVDVRVYHGLSLPRSLETRVFLSLGAGFATPLVVVLLQGWTMARRRAAPLLLLFSSAIFAKLGIFGIVRVLQPVTPAATRAFAATIVVAALAAAVAAALAAMRRTDFRTAVFWIGGCHLALAVAGLFAATPEALTGSMVHVLAHSLAIAALLAFAGAFAPGSAAPADIAFPAGFAALAMGSSGVAVSGGITGSRMIAAGLSDVGAIAQAAAALAVLASAAALMLAVKRALSGGTRPASTGIGAFETAAVAPLAALSLLIAVHPAPLLARLETSVARVVMRVSPQYAPQVADCLNQPAPPPPPDSGLPVGMMLAAPCADGSGKPQEPAKKR